MVEYVPNIYRAWLFRPLEMPFLRRMMNQSPIHLCASIHSAHSLCYQTYYTKRKKAGGEEGEEKRRGWLSLTLTNITILVT